MKKNLLFTALILPAALAFTSCMKTDGNRQETTINYGNTLCFNYVTDLQDPSAAFVSRAPQYTFNIEFYGSTIITSMSNIRLTPDGPSLTFRTPELTASTTTTGYTFYTNATDIIPEGQTQSYLFNNLTLGIIERSILNASGAYKYSPVYNISYTVNNRYHIKVFPTYYDVVGMVTTTGTGTTNSFDSNRAILSLTLSPNESTPTTGKAAIELFDVKFASDNTITRLLAEDIPYTVTSSGIRINTDSETVYKIKDLTGKELPGAGFSDININVAVPGGSTSFSLHANITGLQGNSAQTEYDLRGNMSYYYSTSSSN